MSWMSLIDAFSTGTYTVSRAVESTYGLDGILVPATSSTFKIVASIQPLSGQALRNLPQGQQGDNVRIIYTSTELKTRTDGFEPDIVTINGEPWEVSVIQRWQDRTIETFYEGRLSRMVKP